MTKLKITEGEKKLILSAAIEAASKALTHAFRLCKLEDRIESMIIDDENGEEFVLTFYPSNTFRPDRTKKYSEQLSELLERLERAEEAMKALYDSCRPEYTSGRVVSKHMPKDEDILKVQDYFNHFKQE